MTCYFWYCKSKYDIIKTSHKQDKENGGSLEGYDHFKRETK